MGVQNIAIDNQLPNMNWMPKIEEHPIKAGLIIYLLKLYPKLDHPVSVFFRHIQPYNDKFRYITGVKTFLSSTE